MVTGLGFAVFSGLGFDLGFFGSFLAGYFFVKILTKTGAAGFAAHFEIAFQAAGG